MSPRASPLRPRLLIVALLAGGGAGAVACAPDDPAPNAALRADVNRDGRLDAGDAGDASRWTPERGAVVLANIDDDLGRCQDGLWRTDLALPECNDAADTVVNGAADLADLAPLRVRPWSRAPRGAIGTLSLRPADRARLFRLDRPEPTALEVEARLDRDDLRAGVELGLEAMDVVRDPQDWDGLLDVELRVAADGREAEARVQFHVAPLVVNHHLQPPSQVLVTSVAGEPYGAYREGLAVAVAAAEVPGGLLPVAARAPDPWTQDHFEATWMGAPGPSGPRSMTVFLRSPHVDYFDDPDSPLRRAGRVVFEDFRGPDIGGVQQFVPGGTEEQQTLNSLGNLEVVPPHVVGDRAYPFGRLLIGMTDELAPDPSFLTLLAAQRVQPRIELDTSWLLVGHVDELFSFVPVDSPRGWAVVVGDVAMTLALFESWVEAGQGDAELYSGLSWVDFDDRDPYPATITVAAVLDDPEIMAASAAAEVEIAQQLARLEREVGLEEADLIRVPALHFRSVGASVPYLPSAANLTELGRGHVAVAEPHGPQIGGVDALRAAIIEAFAPHQITVHFVENWDGYHRLNGDVHCGSNVLRARPAQEAWWTAYE